MVDIAHIESRLGINYQAAVMQAVHHPVLKQHQVQLFMKREDLLHPIISGNKWRKLKYNVFHALATGHHHLVSMGGPYSNHLHALAYIGYKLAIKTTGLIRGEQPEQESKTLIDLRNWGMHIRFINRASFRKLRTFREPDSQPAIDYNGYWITEGGANHRALPGIAEILNDIDIDFDLLTLACGTGTTLAGLANTLPEDKFILGFAALKGKDFLEDEVKKLLPDNKNNWSINMDYHFGGFAKKNETLLSFSNDFQAKTSIPVEPIYNGKMLFGLFELIKQGYFKKDSKIIAIHTGGLQGKPR